MATVTAGDLIRKALGKLLVIGTQDTIASSEMDDGLDALNLMLDSWRLERLTIYCLTTTTHVLVGGQQTYTVGPGGNINAARPTKIENATIRYALSDYPLQIINQTQWDAIAYKSVGGLPKRMFYNPQFPLGQINLYPYPLDGSYTLYYDAYAEIESFANIADAYAMPPGYARAIINNLAIELAPDYNKVATPDLMRTAKRAKEAIRTVNAPDVVASMDPSLLSPALIYDITSDGYR